MRLWRNILRSFSEYKIKPWLVGFGSHGFEKRADHRATAPDGSCLSEVKRCAAHEVKSSVAHRRFSSMLSHGLATVGFVVYRCRGRCRPGGKQVAPSPLPVRPGGPLRLLRCRWIRSAVFNCISRPQRKAAGSAPQNEMMRLRECNG